MSHIVIFKCTLKDGSSRSDLLSAWTRDYRVIAEQNGLQAVRLTQSVDSERVFYTILTWESQEARDAAVEGLGLNGPSRDETDLRMHSYRQFADTELIHSADELITLNGSTPYFRNKPDMSTRQQ